MTVMLRLEKFSVLALVLYARGNVCDPAVTVTSVDVLPCPFQASFPLVIEKMNAPRSSVGLVPSTEKLTNPEVVPVTRAVTITSTFVPVVSVTDGFVGLVQPLVP
jgi:hypothetical protein